MRIKNGHTYENSATKKQAVLLGGRRRIFEKLDVVKRYS